MIGMVVVATISGFSLDSNNIIIPPMNTMRISKNNTHICFSLHSYPHDICMGAKKHTRRRADLSTLSESKIAMSVSAVSDVHNILSICFTPVLFIHPSIYLSVHLSIHLSITSYFAQAVYIYIYIYM